MDLSIEVGVTFQAGLPGIPLAHQKILPAKYGSQKQKCRGIKQKHLKQNVEVGVC